MPALTPTNRSDRRRERVVRAGGHSVYVRERGEGDPLLLINGIGAHIGMWGALERRLDGLRVIAFDAPGTGRSETPVVPLSLDGLARLAEHLLDALGYEHADVLGYSYGGIVAQRLARRAGARVRRLVLAATTPGWGGVPGSLRTLARMSTPLRYYSRSYYESIVGDLMGGRARFDRGFVERSGAVRREHPPNGLGYMWQLAALAADPGSLPWLHTLTQPTLVIAGDDDPILPLPNALILAHRIPRARLLVVAGEGHLLLLHPGSTAVAATRDFLTAADPADSKTWQQALPVTQPMVDEALRANGSILHHPVSLASTAVRMIWPV